jgi:hypothetical protein
VRPLAIAISTVKVLSIRSATFYKSKAKYGGLDVPDAKRLRALE